MNLPGTLLESYNSTRPEGARRLFCFAPSVNLNFQQSGNVTACCYNHVSRLGTWPDQSLEEMWNGEPARLLRRQMAQGDLPPGCKLCSEQFHAGNFAGLHAAQYDNYHFPENDPVMPRIMEFEISNVCNLECMMCSGNFSSSIRKNREKLPPLKIPYDDRFIDQLEPFLPYLKFAKFLGGEPFLNPLYYKIWSRIMKGKHAVQCDITTNGSILNNKVKRMLEALKPSLVVSVDSLNQKRYEQIRKNADFKTLMKNIDYFIEHRNPAKPLTISVCPMQYNWRDLPEIVTFGNQRGVFIYFNTVIWPPDASLKTLDPAKLREVVAFLKLAPIDRGRGTAHVGNMQSYEGMVRQVESWLPAPKMPGARRRPATQAQEARL